MSHKEVDRLGVIRQVAEKQLRQKEAARQLDLSVRQIRRLVQRYRAEGPAGLVSRRRGKRPNNRIDETLRQEILDLVRSRYADFGPTLACEKLAQCHDRKVSVETLRQWMIADGFWKPKARKQARIHQRRPRRPCRGGWFRSTAHPMTGSRIGALAVR